MKMGLPLIIELGVVDSANCDAEYSYYVRNILRLYADIDATFEI
jgi:hypothetical protein